MGRREMWWLLTIMAAIVFFFMGPSDRPTAIGGGATIGLIAGIIIAIAYGDWWLVGKAIVVCILVGLLHEVLSRMIERVRG